ncbi:GTPase domain-containing protein [Georgenia wutianyii]|uniref:GTPase domain-containing protein n=1 Tax=Georgenia wutianyii TaxID=2585135 RepID=A0ABX5VJJ6_9MICO|nr:GTPase domain-containing protein [Georgenia wutianyii]QDB78607.1 GTPase domain-containing protein [Georgenia wutianyii]
MTTDLRRRDGGPSRHVRGRSPILDVVVDLHEDVAAARFPLDLPGAPELTELRDRIETQIGAHLLPRLKREAGPAVVVLGGSTGAGKSTLVNSVVGREVTQAGVIRPTTTEPLLVVSEEDTWLVAEHPIARLADVVADDRVPAGLALLDAPDLDSVLEGNRALANLLLETADLWLFVTTAARYGDAVPWRVLRQAQERGITVAVVLNRVPRRVLAEVRGDLMRRMTDLGMGEAPLFVVPDVGPHEGLLPEEVVEPVRTWLTLLGGRNTARGVVRRTTQGVWGTLREELLRLADGITAQAMAAGALRSCAEQAVAGAGDALVARLRAGAAAQGAPTTRWLAAASTGGVLAPLTGDVSRVRRGWRGGGLRARTEAAEALGAEVRRSLVTLTAAAATSAAAELDRAWSERGGAALLEHDPAWAAGRDTRAEEAVAAWAARSDALAAELIGADPRVLTAAGLSGLLQAAAAGLDGAARATRAVAPGQDAVARVTADLHETARAVVGEEAGPALDRLAALGLRSDAGAGLRLRASELKGHR